MERLNKRMEDAKYKRIVLLIATSAYFLAPYMASSVNIALPAIQNDFSANAVLLSWISTAYLLATAVVLLAVGKLADIYGRKKIFTIGVLGMSVSSLFFVFVHSAGMLIVLRCFQGIFGAMIMTTAIAIVTSIFPVHERGKALGVMVASAYAGLSAGPFIGGMLTNFIHWRSIFFVVFLIGILSVVLTLKFLKGEWTGTPGDKFDIPGNIIYGVVLILLVYGSTVMPGRLGIILLMSGIAGVVIFIKHQLVAKYPVMAVKIFKNNRILIFSNLASLINYAATSAVTFLLSLYLQYIKGLAPQVAGLVILTFPVVQVLLSTYSGKLSDRFEHRKIASAGMACSALSLFIFVFLGPQTRMVPIMGSLVLLGIGLALFAPPNTNSIMSSVGKQYYGVASGLVALMRLLGQTISMTLATLIISLYIGQSQITPAKYSAFLNSSKTAYIVFVILCVIGTYLSYIRNKPSVAAATG